MYLKIEQYHETDPRTLRRGFYNYELLQKYELYKLYLNRVAIGGFANTFYWSSVEFGNSLAGIQSFTNGNQGNYGKSDTYRVRAVRAF